jgi:hypothetical protein
LPLAVHDRVYLGVTKIKQEKDESRTAIISCSGHWLYFDLSPDEKEMVRKIASAFL